MNAYCLVGAAFVEGAVEEGDPTVSRVGVWLLLFFAAIGLAMITVGMLGFRRGKAPAM